MSKIGEKIRVRRKNLGLSQERLAERLSVSRQTISSWENGKSAIKLENAKPLSDELKLTSCGSISGHLVTIPYQIIKHIPTSALLEA